MILCQLSQNNSDPSDRFVLVIDQCLLGSGGGLAYVVRFPYGCFVLKEIYQSLT